MQRYRQNSILHQRSMLKISRSNTIIHYLNPNGFWIRRRLQTNFLFYCLCFSSTSIFSSFEVFDLTTVAFNSHRLTTEGIIVRQNPCSLLSSSKNVTVKRVSNISAITNSALYAVCKITNHEVSISFPQFQDEINKLVVKSWILSKLGDVYLREVPNKSRRRCAAFRGWLNLSSQVTVSPISSW